MSLTKETEIVSVEMRKIEGIPFLQVKEVTRVFENNVEISATNHRYSFAPTDDLTGQNPDVLQLANIYFTQEMKDAYTESQENML